MVQLLAPVPLIRPLSAHARAKDSQPRRRPVSRTPPPCGARPPPLTLRINVSRSEETCQLAIRNLNAYEPDAVHNSQYSFRAEATNLHWKPFLSVDGASARTSSQMLRLFREKIGKLANRVGGGTRPLFSLPPRYFFLRERTSLGKSLTTPFGFFQRILRCSSPLQRRQVPPALCSFRCPASPPGPPK